MTKVQVVQLARLPVSSDYRPPPHLSITEAFNGAALDGVDTSAVTALVTHSVFGVPEALWDRFPALRLIANFGAGLDRIDLDAARGRGVRVTYTPDHLTADVADLALAMILALLRRLPEAQTFVRKRGDGAFPLGSSASGRRLGVLGLGRVGRAVADRGAMLGMRVGYFSRTPKPDAPYRAFSCARALADFADILVATVPGGAQTDGLVSAAVLEALGPQGLFVNVARASVVDEPALILALRSGALAGAGLEVFGGTGSRLPETLGDLPNVILTPHIGSATTQTRTAMADAVYANVGAMMLGRQLTDVAI